MPPPKCHSYDDSQGSVNFDTWTGDSDNQICRIPPGGTLKHAVGVTNWKPSSLLVHAHVESTNWSIKFSYRGKTDIFWDTGEKPITVPPIGPRNRPFPVEESALASANSVSNEVNQVVTVDVRFKMPYWMRWRKLPQIALQVDVA